ncbi:unnamed protein product [Cuscuta epithymum]|uniref:J domain-containing protein n=1 Tax=Cuscuta epithymum TaxID=186058 RepID=A0AAV0CPC0_9ASTE|nr:unnamed protein product [Cuscuta epithymum]
MSRAARDCAFISPITLSNVFPATPNIQNDTRQYPERHLAAASTSSFGSSNLASSTSDGFNCSFVSEKCAKSSRLKPRMAKTMRQSKKSESVGDGLGFNPFKLGHTSSGSGSAVGPSGGSSGLDTNPGSSQVFENSKQMGCAENGNPMFVFGANKSETHSRKFEFVFGANQNRPRSMSTVEIDSNVTNVTMSSSVSNSKFENAANLHSNAGQKASDNIPLQSGTFDFRKIGGGASVFTGNISVLQPNNMISNEHSKSINPNNSFGEKSFSGLNFDFQSWGNIAEQNGSATNLFSVKKETIGGGRTPLPEMNGTAAPSFESNPNFPTDNAFTGFVFGANNAMSSSYANTKAKKPFRNPKACKGSKPDSNVVSQKGSSGDVFVFKGSSDIQKTSYEDSSKFHVNQKFVFGSQNVLGADVSELSSEFNSLSMSAKANNMSCKSHSNSKHMFIFGCNQNTFDFSTVCGSADKSFNNQHENVNPMEPGYDESAGKVKKINVTFGTEEKEASSVGVGTQHVMAKSLDKSAEFVNCSEQFSSRRSSAEIYGKKNNPIKLTSSDRIQYYCPHDDTNVQVNGGATVPSSLNKDEKTDQSNFTSFPFGMGGTFRDFKETTSSEAFSFNADLFSGLNKKMVCESRKSMRHKKVKTKKIFSNQNLVRDQTDQQNNESPVCGSPMDFSPYRNTKSEAENKCHGPSESNLEVGSRNCLDDQKNIAFSAEPSSIDGLSAIRRQYKKKYRTKGCNPANQTIQQNSASASHVQFPHTGQNDSSKVQNGDASHPHENGAHLFSTNEGHAKQEFPEFEACEKCRIRGNKAYKAGDLSRADEFYSKGIRSVSHSNIPECCIQPLLLCYSNRAATRMSLCRVREAINDCSRAAALDPSFLKVKLRAGNCYLLLGEVQEAVVNYNSCLESKAAVCLDRRIAIEASNGLQKAEKVAEKLRLSVELLQQKTADAAKGALEIIAEALCISLYSEKLLEMKAEGLCMLQKYGEAIKLCEQTLDFAEKNHVSLSTENIKGSLRMWRWCIMSKSYYYLGKLEAALHLIEKQEQVLFVKDRSGNISRESPLPLGAVIRDLLDHKKAGNEAFQSKKFAEALDHYNAAISCSVESRPFAAICFCNLAAAHQSLGQIIDAIADCSVAMALDENYSKAASRRATLHEMIRDYAHAVTDLQMLISLLENQNSHQDGSQDRSTNSGSSTLKELRKARQRLSSVQEKAKSGIPLDLYLILGIKASDPESDIKKAYKKAALKHHPDKAVQFLAKTESMEGQLRKDISDKVQKDADRLFKMIGEAYAILSDSNKRSNYDYEEEIRSMRKQMNTNYSCTNSPFRRSSSSRRYGQDTWRTYGDSRSEW